MVLASAGFVLLALTGVDDLPTLIVGYLLVALGLSPMITLCTDLVISTAPSRRAGAASALSESGGELGVALGVAVLGSLGTAVYRSRIDGELPEGLPAKATESVRDTLGGAGRIAADLPGDLADALLTAARGALTLGLNLTSATAAPWPWRQRSGRASGCATSRPRPRPRRGARRVTGRAAGRARRRTRPWRTVTERGPRGRADAISGGRAAG